MSKATPITNGLPPISRGPHTVLLANGGETSQQAPDEAPPTLVGAVARRVVVVPLFVGLLSFAIFRRLLGSR